MVVHQWKRIHEYLSGQEPLDDCKGDHGNCPHSLGINMIQNRNNDRSLCKCMALNAVLVKT